jgi:hypothetical protein
MSAITNPGNTANRAYTFKPNFEVKTYSLLEAIEMASRGSLTPIDVYLQLPVALQKEIDALANLGSPSTFSNLSLKEQSDAFMKLKKRIKDFQVIESLIKKVSTLKAIEKARRGKIDDLLLFAYLPTEIKNALNVLSNNLHKRNYDLLSTNERHEILGILVKMTGNSSSSNGLFDKIKKLFTQVFVRKHV